MITLTPEFWKDFTSTVGAFSCAEAVCLRELVLESKPGVFLELGSHRGRSSICIASALPTQSSLILVEPEFENKEWHKDVFDRVSKYLIDETKFRLFIGYSCDAISVFNEISFCFVDSGTHSDDLVMNESKMLEDRMIIGGIIAYHDKGSQFTKVDEAYSYLLSTGKYEEVKIDWNKIFDYLKENDLQDGELSWHVYPELPHPPNFIGALRRK